MKNKIYFRFLGLIAIIVLFGCEPFMDDKPDAGLVLPPSAGEMDFSITPGTDAYHFTVQLTKPTLSGISAVSFDLGNGSVVKKETANAYYPLPNSYTITMTITTNGGSSSITKTHTTTATDYSLFTDPTMVMISGGSAAVAGKTWVVDSLTAGHFGIGPAAGTWPEWWSATPLQKTGSGAYDDELIFKLEGFSFASNNNGDSYVKDYRKTNPNYSNPVEVDGTDCRVNYTPAPATWTIVTKDDGDYIVLSSAKPAFFGFDYGAVGNEFRIEELTENFLYVSCIGGDGNRWYNKLIPKGYERPSFDWAITGNSGTEVNSFDVALNVTNTPVGESIEKFTVDFGDGNVVESMDINEIISGTYMRAGTYTVNVTLYTSLGELVKTTENVVANNHPDYEEFILNEIVMYADFSEVMLAPVNGENCFVGVEDNPSRIYPNKSAKVGFYSKTSQEWANANLKLPAGYRFDLRLRHTFSVKVYGKAGDKVLLKLENTDREGNAWQTGTYDLIYTIEKDNTWEIATYDFDGVAAGYDWTGDQFASNIVTDDKFNHGFYNIVRIMLNPGVADGTHEFYFDELAGPHVEGIKSARIK